MWILNVVHCSSLFHPNFLNKKKKNTNWVANLRSERNMLVFCTIPSYLIYQQIFTFQSQNFEFTYQLFFFFHTARLSLELCYYSTRVSVMMHDFLKSFSLYHSECSLQLNLVYLFTLLFHE
jgi:hypothetical protein